LATYRPAKDFYFCNYYQPAIAIITSRANKQGGTGKRVMVPVKPEFSQEFEMQLTFYTETNFQTRKP